MHMFCLNCDNRANQIRETFDSTLTMLYPDTMDRVIPLGGDDAIKRYRRHANSCLSSPNSTVIISNMADSYIQYIVFTTHTKMKTIKYCWCVYVLLLSTRPLLFTGAPNPLRPAFTQTYNQLNWCFDTPDCKSVVFKSLKEGEISFKIFMLTTHPTPQTHTIFLFLF